MGDKISIKAGPYWQVRGAEGSTDAKLVQQWVRDHVISLITIVRVRSYTINLIIIVTS